MAKGGFFILRDTLSPALLTLNPHLRTEENLRDYEDQVLEYAQTNAPWDDRTGDAREGLSARVFSEKDNVILELSHGVSYGLYLEVKNSGEFAIVMPTLEVFAGPIFEALGVIPTGEDLIK